ncbi:hypothetical protein KP509_12G083500 [Ceratopteris richardii]|uniref:Trichome birefringence-like C-terminal domain-containing protein n=1 Tax=Ceratopteris richardii TaxID=49495 RepID=A0A8T2TQC2_CERRI|nr:hypothetical protein KP509_12G083500 [Ceratopteris richardii]
MAWPEGTEKNGDNELLLSKKPQKEKYFSGEEKTGMRNAVDHTDDTPWLEVGEQGRTFGQPKAPKEKHTEKGKLKSATDVFVTDSDKEIFFRGENVSKNDDGRKVDWFYNQSNMPFIRQKSSSNHDLSSKNVPKKRRSNEYDEGEIWRSKQQVEYDDDENGLTEQEEKRNIANKVIHDSDEDAFTSKGKKNQLKSTAVLEDADKDHFMRKIKKYRHRNGIEDGYKLLSNRQKDLSRNKIVEDEEDEADLVEREKKGSYKEDIAEYADKDGGSTKRGKNKVPHVEHYLDEHNQMHIVGMSDEDEEAKKKKMRNKQKMDTAFEEIEDGDISFYDPLELLYNTKANGSLSWNFKSWDVAISVIWSPFLVQRKIEDHYTVLQLDKLDIKWRTMMPSVNVLVLGVGSHFNQPILYRVRDEIVGCYSCQELQTSVDIKGVKELSLFSGFRATIRSSIMGIGGFPGFEGLVFFLQPFGFEGVGSFHGLSSKMKDIQETEIDRAFDKGIIHNDAMMKVIHTDLYALGKNDPIKAHLGDCLIPSPLADAWNQVLQNMLVDVSSHSSNIQ